MGGLVPRLLPSLGTRLVMGSFSVVKLVSFPDPQYVRKEGLANIVQNF